MRDWFWLLLGPSLAGGLVGALLLNWSGNRSFTVLIPWLILIATLLTLRPLVSRAGQPRQPAQTLTPAEANTATSVLHRVSACVLLFVVAIYGGYFGAGIGILVIAAVDLVGLSDIHSILPLKNALCGSLRAVAIAVFVIERKVDWEYGLVMAAGAVFGGYLGGSIVHWVNRTWVRIVIVALGFSMSAYYFWRTYGGEIHLIGGD